MRRARTPWQHGGLPPLENHRMADHRPFTRSRDDRMIAGVMGGIARRLGLDATLLRVLFVIVSIASAAFPGIIVYLLLWLLMPLEGEA